eukprot:g42447.t1
MVGKWEAFKNEIMRVQRQYVLVSVKDKTGRRASSWRLDFLLQSVDSGLDIDSLGPECFFVNNHILESGPLSSFVQGDEVRSGIVLLLPGLQEAHVYSFQRQVFTCLVQEEVVEGVFIKRRLSSGSEGPSINNTIPVDEVVVSAKNPSSSCLGEEDDTKSPPQLGQAPQMLREHVYTVSLLQETHTVPEDEVLSLLEWQGRVFMSHLTSNSGGMVILLIPLLKPEILKVKGYMPGHLLQLRVHFGGTLLHLVNIYVPWMGPELMCSFAEVLHVGVKEAEIQDRGVGEGGVHVLVSSMWTQ